MVTSKQWEEVAEDACKICPSHTTDACESCPIHLYWCVAYGNDMYGKDVCDKEVMKFKAIMNDNIYIWELEK